MPEWWHTLTSYRLDDLLMFSPRTFARLAELINAETWPLPLLAAAAPLGLLVALRAIAPRPADAARAGALAGLLAGARPEAALLGLLALASAVLAEWFFRRSFAGLTWIAPHWAAAFALVALLGAALAALAWRERAEPPAAPPTTPPAAEPGAPAAQALALLLAGGALAWPLAAPAFGRPWLQAEVFALAPDPTVLGWLAWGAVTRQRGLVWLAVMAVPLAWCVFSGLMGAAMAAPLAAVLPMAAAAVVAQRLLRARRRAGGIRRPGNAGRR